VRKQKKKNSSNICFTIVKYTIGVIAVGGIFVVGIAFLSNNGVLPLP